MCQLDTGQLGDCPPGFFTRLGDAPGPSGEQNQLIRKWVANRKAGSCTSCHSLPDLFPMWAFIKLSPLTRGGQRQIIIERANGAGLHWNWTKSSFYPTLNAKWITQIYMEVGALEGPHQGKIGLQFNKTRGNALLTNEPPVPPTAVFYCGRP